MVLFSMALSFALLFLERLPGVELSRFGCIPLLRRPVPVFAAGGSKGASESPRALCVPGHVAAAGRVGSPVSGWRFAPACCAAQSGCERLFAALVLHVWREHGTLRCCSGRSRRLVAVSPNSSLAALSLRALPNPSVKRTCLRPAAYLKR